MVTAIILLKVEHDKINVVAERLAGMKAISEVYSVGGRYDLVAIVRVKENEELADVVTKHMVGLEGIRKTETMVAFRAYSRHDLEATFSVGLEDPA